MACSTPWAVIAPDLLLYPPERRARRSNLSDDVGGNAAEQRRKIAELMAVLSRITR